MGISVNEIVLVLMMAAIAVGFVRVTGRRWIAVLPLAGLVAALMSPSDVVSTLMIALPNFALMALAVRLGNPPTDRRPSATA